MSRIRERITRVPRGNDEVGSIVGGALLAAADVADSEDVAPELGPRRRLRERILDRVERRLEDASWVAVDVSPDRPRPPPRTPTPFAARCSLVPLVRWSELRTATRRARSSRWGEHWGALAEVAGCDDDVGLPAEIEIPDPDGPRGKITSASSRLSVTGPRARGCSLPRQDPRKLRAVITMSPTPPLLRRRSGSPGKGRCRGCRLSMSVVRTGDPCVASAGMSIRLRYDGPICCPPVWGSIR